MKKKARSNRTSRYPEVLVTEHSLFLISVLIKFCFGNSLELPLQVPHNIFYGDR